MSRVVLAMPSAARSTESAGRLLAVIRQLEEIGDALAQDGMGEEAGSLATVIADLHWQSEELFNKDFSKQHGCVACC